MRHSTLASALLASSLGVLAACGGGGGGYAVDVDPLRILATEITESPAGPDTNSLYESADTVDFEIPLAGGCGGPYVLSVIDGAMPEGVGLVGGTDPVTQEALHHIRGALLEDGEFAFRLQVVDRSCEPFQSTYADVLWTVARGRVAIVGANPVLWAPGTQVRLGQVQNPVYHALNPVVYNQFTAIDLYVAGGVPPYSLQVVDDPGNPDDGSLPLGVSIPPDSTSLVGAPSEVHPGGTPFVMTFEARDSLGQTGRLAIQWKIDTPPIVLANTDLQDGKAGTSYVEPLTVVDGVPPFQFEFVKCDVDRDVAGEPTVVWNAPLPPTVSPACALVRVQAADYPLPDAAGPDYTSTMAPPEGIFLGDVEGNPLASAGTIAGVPRRRGDFQVVVHVLSALLPNERGQQQWGRFEFTIAPSEPPLGSSPAFAQDPAYTTTGAFSAASPWAEIAEALVGKTYNPDAATHSASGLQLLAEGGVRKDGLTDAPHASEVTSVEGLNPGQEDSTTPGGGYDWTVDPNPPADGDAYSAMPPGLALLGHLGVWDVTDVGALVKQGRQAFDFTVLDQQLPTQVRNRQTQRVVFSVGPDKMILTESTTSDTSTTISTSTQSMHDPTTTVRALEIALGAVSARNLNDTDLAKNTVVPATTGLSGTTALGTLLSNQDLCSVSVNPTGWWDDGCGLNANAARPMQHGDSNRYYAYYNMSYVSSSSYWYGWRPNVQAVALPDVTAPTVTHAPANGIYTDGGKLYAFGNGSYFGVFVVRSDSQVYVPCAFDRTTYQCFGDSWVTTYASSQGWPMYRTPQLTVSPDGRFGALKLRRQETNFYETANSTDIVVFSLTGERAFDGNTYKVIGTGASGGYTSGTYLYAASLTLTNRHLYYLCGNFTGYDAVQNHGHFAYRYEIAAASGSVTASATTGALLPSEAGDSEWTNTAGTEGLQVTFQAWTHPLGSQQLAYDGMNFPLNASARVPFRVSRNGKACAIVAAQAPYYAYDWSGDPMNMHVWVDQEGAGVRRASSTRRRIVGGASRGYGITRGPQYYPNYGQYTGPTTQFEISDDATRVAVVVNRYTGYMEGYYSFSYYWSAREDVVVFTTTNGWDSATETFVTGNDSGSSRPFAGTTVWRFGCLVFTKDGRGLVFWGGSSSWNATAYSQTFLSSTQWCGTFYGCDLVGSPSTVTSLLSSTDGGSPDGVKSYTNSSPMSPSQVPNGDYSSGGAYTHSGVYGVIKPVTGFLSRNREFFYVVNSGALNSSTATNYRLVSVNVRSTNTSASVNGHADFRGFAVGSWPTGRSFCPQYGYYPYYQVGYYTYARTFGGSLQVMARDSGRVFFSSNYNPYSYNYNNYYYYGGPVHVSQDGNYGTYCGEVEVFDSDIGGPIQRISSLGGDNYASYRRVHWIEPNALGDEVTWVLDTYGSTVWGFTYETVYYAGNIQLSSTGTLLNTPRRVTSETSVGRAGEAMAFGFLPRRFYYAFRAGSSNENLKDLKEAVIDPTTGQQSTRTLVSGKRFNVLHVGR